MLDIVSLPMRLWQRHRRIVVWYPGSCYEEDNNAIWLWRLEILTMLSKCWNAKRKVYQMYIGLWVNTRSRCQEGRWSSRRKDILSPSGISNGKKTLNSCLQTYFAWPFLCRPHCPSIPAFSIQLEILDCVRWLLRPQIFPTGFVSAGTAGL